MRAINNGSLKVPGESFMTKHFYYNSLLMRIRDDDITATEVRINKERDRVCVREREIKCERDREGKKP